MDFMILGALTFALTFAGMFAFRPLAKKINLIDHPQGRKQHLAPTPMHGGLAIFSGIMLALLLSDTPADLFTGYFLLSSALLMIGIIDDVKDTSAKMRFALQAGIASLAVIYFDVRIETLGVISPLGSIELGIFSYPFTIFCFMAAINSINMIDGLDGLAGSLVMIPASLLALILIPNGHEQLGVIALAVAASCLAFLTQNAPFTGNRAKVFMGDSGSTLIGFSLAWILIEASQASNQAFTPVSALWFLAIPLIDSGTVIFKRTKDGRSPMAPGRDHIHHLLLQYGLSEKQAFFLLATSCLITCLAQLGFMYINTWESISMIALGAIGMGYYKFSTNHLTKEQTALKAIELHSPSSQNTPTSKAA